MAEFDNIERQREEERCLAISNAVQYRLSMATQYQRCIRCNKEFREIDAIGHRDCSFHPEPYNEKGYGDDSSPMPRSWTNHHSCCGWTTRDVNCGSEGFIHPKYAMRHSGDGCTPCEHNSSNDIVLPRSILGHPGVVELCLSTDPVADDDPMANLVRVEPIFFLRALAKERNIDLESPGGFRTLLGGAAAYVANNPRCISALGPGSARFRLGAERMLDVPLRAAYVAMLQRYGLPTALLTGNAITGVAAHADHQTPRSALPAEALSFFDSFLGGSPAASPDVLPRSGDVLVPSDRGQWVPDINTGRGSTVNATVPGLQIDTYYDVHPTRSADGGILTSSQRNLNVPWQDMSTAGFLTSLTKSLAGPSAKTERFYPFCIWLVCDGLPIHTTPLVLPSGTHHHNARF